MKRLGIFFFYEKNGDVDAFITYYLRDLARNLTELIVVCNGKLSKQGRAAFEEFTDQIIVRENKGLDVWAYKTALDHYGWQRLSEFDEVVMTNSTLMGPVRPLKEMFDAMAERTNLDFWGLTIHHGAEGNPFKGKHLYNYLPVHTQSHFIVYRKKFIQSKELQNYWDTMPMIESYTDSVQRYESVFTKQFADKGYQWDVYVNTDDLKEFTDYPLLVCPTRLLRDKKCPLFKRRSFMHDFEAYLNDTAGEPVREGSTTRPVQYEDCCILLSARGDFPAYVEALTARGIPVYADARENLMEAPHIRPLISLLKVIDNPAQDIYLAAAMLGPVFGFTDDDLVRLRAQSAALQKEQNAGNAGKPARMSLYGALLLARQGPAEDPFTQKVNDFYDKLTALRQMARSVPAEQLLEEIFATTGYLAALGVTENGARRREDARRFASFCAASGAGGISALVRAIDAAALAGSTGQDTTPGGARPGCVTVMTIHRSKGLQFPVVFVADTARRFNAADTRQPVLLHRMYGAGLRLRPEEGEGAYKTAAYTALSNVHAAEMRSEQMRLLYVALTRAQDKLILTVPLGIGKTSNPFARAAAFLEAGAGQTLCRQANSFADWLRAALLVHPNGGPLRRLAEDLELPFADTGSTITLTVQQALPEGVEPPDPELEERPLAQADPALTEALRQGFAWQYPAAELAGVPAKVSVTGIVHKAEQTTLERPGFLAKDGLTAAEMGTALHAFLEHADFMALAAAKQAGTLEMAIPAERDRQVEAKLTAPEIAEKLDEKRIRRFVESEAFARICAANEVLRELDFITALPAAEVLTAQGTAPADSAAVAQAKVLVQGIADLVLVFPDHLELLDYKTDRRKSEADFLAAYRAQLDLYALAISKRFAPKPVTYKGIYSLELGKLIEVK